MEPSKQAIRSVFDSFDKDHSGSLTYDEIASVAKELGQEFSAQDLKKVNNLKNEFELINFGPKTEIYLKINRFSLYFFFFFFFQLIFISFYY
jgi:EF-hand domain